MDLHVSIKVMGVHLEVQQDTSSCLYHCPICALETFRPTDLKTARKHLESHTGRSFHHGGYTIYKCHLKCRKTQHFHCYKCSGCIIRRVDLLKHISSCNPMPTTPLPGPTAPMLVATAPLPVPTAPPAAPLPVPTAPPAAPLPVPTAPPAAPLPVPTAPLPGPTASPAGPKVTPLGPLTKRRQNIMQCPHCNLLLNSKNLKRHLQRRHTALVKDITADRNLQCIDADRGIYAISKAVQGGTPILIHALIISVYFLIGNKCVRIYYSQRMY
ncbi:hypothetical protein ANANG_G00105400 [Anguilla anguilla]|uniref:Uncharacterized protein n=1 Tax=Anguilla anguilla TaxID=7936 RepID=A0A9D3RZI1_ANGAN|nr:hypothetical protein ANANG_G00105400 [Anguilla anguilla]